MTLPRWIKVPILRRKLPGLQMGESRKGRTRSIRVAPRLRGAQALSTLIHEAIHQIDHRLSEGTVRQLEQALVFLVIDNPEVFRALDKRLNRP